MSARPDNYRVAKFSEGALRSLFISPLGWPARERGKKAAARENFAWLVCALAKRLAHRSFLLHFLQ